MAPVSNTTPKFIPSVSISIQPRNNSREMKPVQRALKSVSGSHPSSRRTSVQPHVVKGESSARPVSTVTKTQEKRTQASLTEKKNGLISASKASLSDGASTKQSRVKKTTRLTPMPSGGRASKRVTVTHCTAQRKKQTQRLPEASGSHPASATNLEPRKESTHVLRSEDCASRKLGTTSILVKEGTKHLPNASQRIVAKISSQRKTLKTSNLTRGLSETLEHTSNGLKRPAIPVSFKAKKTKLQHHASHARKSASPSSCTTRTAPLQMSEKMDVQMKQRETSKAPVSLPQRHLSVARFKTQGKQKESSAASTIPTESRVTTRAGAHHVPSISNHIKKSSRTVMVPSKQTTSMEICPSPKSLLMTTGAADGPIKKRNMAVSVSSMQSISQRSAVVTKTYHRKGLPTAASAERYQKPMSTTTAPRRLATKTSALSHVSPVKRAIPPASPVLRTTPQTKGNKIENEKKAMLNTVQPRSTPENRKHNCSVKECLLRRLQVPSSSVSNMKQSMKVDKPSVGTNSKDESSTMFDEHTTKVIKSKTTISPPLIPTTKKMTKAMKKPLFRKDFVNVASERDDVMIPVKVQQQVKIKPPDVKVKPGNAVVRQSRLTHDRPANFQKCDMQNLNTSIIPGSSDLRKGSAKKLTLVGHACMKRRIATTLEIPNETSIRKPAAIAEPVTVFTQVSADSTNPAGTVIEHIRPTAPGKVISKTKASQTIDHSSIANQRARPMEKTRIPEEAPLRTIAGMNKALATAETSAAGKIQHRPPSNPSKSGNRSGTIQNLENRVMLREIEEECSEQGGGSSLQPRSTAAKTYPLLPSPASGRTGCSKNTEPCETSRSPRVAKDDTNSTAQNRADMMAGKIDSPHEKSNGFAAERVENVSPRSHDSSPRVSDTTGNVMETPSSSPADPIAHPEGLTVFELPYGRVRTIALRENDMERHIPVWNTKLKYKVAGTAAPLGKNIARYLERKMGEFELYDKQERYEPAQDRKNARVTIWHKIEKRKISGTSAPLRKNIQRYLREHPHCEEYVDQQSKLDATEKKNANARVTVWNKIIGRKQGFGQSGPLRKNLKRYLLQHPHLEEYKGQDRRKSGDRTGKEVHETEGAQQDEQNLTKDDDESKSEKIVRSDNPEEETIHAKTTEEDTSEKVVDTETNHEPEVLEMSSEESDEAESFAGSNRGDVVGVQPEVLPLPPVDMSDIPDLNVFPFSGESVYFGGFELDSNSFLDRGHERQLEDVSNPVNPVPNVSFAGMETGIDFQDAICGDLGDAFIGSIVHEQKIDIGVGIDGDSELPPVDLEPLDTVEMFPNLESGNRWHL